MDNLLAGILVGCLLSLFAWLALRGMIRKAPKENPTEVRANLESLRAVGELVVLKVYTQQIVTRTDHLFGDWGEKWLQWLVSAKKTAMIFDFVVDFRYDLKSPLFRPEVSGNDRIRFTMPPCFYEIQMKDIRIYDEKAAALVPLLLPEWIGQIFGGKFSEKEKNALIRAARQEAEGLARELTQKILGEVQRSAEATLRSIASAMWFKEAEFAFNEGLSMQGTVDLSPIEATAKQAVGQGA
ncbi:MAG: DUF4230 domain-containing protein [Candidatus Omnitrophica bacterium]|nr:hypothetical protein [bacterium]NUN96729.1 DUF4230 domain-containing protein [Candidatus Omnitrophota bacterium]